ncbi:hypothetical protein JCM4814A_93380 [Streptomyces phaeofaciens JCM 4814]|uniref:Uncharacterized protein n=2 Tax=Streptomyces phaeofaciens TaxID=68254 RepID=A0A918HJM0_9ACTN|nr:hypothetical protein GCM10010226_56720 [Streptomyces phaeofaciens]
MTMDAIVSSAATALVGAMTTETWQQARTALVAWWRRIRPQQASRVDAALVECRNRVQTARRAGDENAESQLVAAWRSRLNALLRDDPSLVDELRRLIDEEITPLLRHGDGSRTGSHEFRAEASGHGRVFQAGHDQHIHES